MRRQTRRDVRAQNDQTEEIYDACENNEQQSCPAKETLLELAGDVFDSPFRLFSCLHRVPESYLAYPSERRKNLVVLYILYTELSEYRYILYKNTFLKII